MSNKFLIIPGVLPKITEAYPSKSMSHRALFLAAQNPSGCAVHNLSLCEDVLVTLEALKRCGCSVSLSGTEVFVKYGKIDKTNIEIDCGSSGSTLRFLIPYILSEGISAVITGSDQLKKRPIDEYQFLFKDENVLLGNSLPMQIAGKITGGFYRMKGTVSSQYASGIMMAAPKLIRDSLVIYSDSAVSKPYMNLTAFQMEEFGLEVQAIDKGYYIRANQRVSCSDYTVEGDWSLAAFWILLGIARASDGLCIKGLNSNSFQGDRQILDFLSAMGCHYNFSKHGLNVYAQKISGDYSFSLKNTPDLFPVLCAFAGLTSAKITFTDIEALRFKESNRIKTVVAALSSLGIHICESENGVFVDGALSAFRNKSVDLADDHRIAFACVLWALGSGNELCIDDLSCVEKSWPTFVQQLCDYGLCDCLGGIS